MIVKNIGENLTAEDIVSLQQNPETSRVVNGNILTIYQGDEPPEPSQQPSPNWFGLEQDLVYSALFQRAKSQAPPNNYSTLGFALQNGKRGEASLNFLHAALSTMWDGSESMWTENEVEQLNQILANNNFPIQI